MTVSVRVDRCRQADPSSFQERVPISAYAVSEGPI